MSMLSDVCFLNYGTGVATVVHQTSTSQSPSGTLRSSRGAAKRV